MTKDQIMNYVWPQRGELDVLAAQHASVEVIEAKVAEIKREEERAAIWGPRILRAMFIPFALLVLSGICLYLENILLALGSMAVAMVTIHVLQNTGRHLEWRERYCKSMRDALQPIAGTDACREALEYLEGDAPGVADWRDIALAERGQLYDFDVSVMGRLHRLEQQRLTDEARRKVHGLAPLGPVAAPVHRAARRHRAVSDINGRSACHESRT